MKTFILEWRPAISNYKLNDYEEALDASLRGDVWFNWSIWDWKELKVGDEFYMIKCGEEPTGIVMHGHFTSEPYLGEDWSGKGRETYYADMRPDSMTHPLRSQMITTAMLEEAMPDFQWNGGHSGRVLPEEYAQKLRQIWDNYHNGVLDEKEGE